MKRNILFVLLAVFLLTFVVSAAMLIHVYLEYSKAESLYLDLQKDVVTEVTPAPPSTGEEETPPAKETASAPIAVDFEKLLETNRDVVGWIYCEDTVISYPVVRGETNEEYLHADLNGDYLRCGTIFADCNNSPYPMVEKNYIVYGHSMRNDSMFGTLLDYKRQSYYDQHPVWYYLTPDGNYRVELIAGIVAKTGRDIFSTMLNAEVMVRELSVIKGASTFVSNVDYTEEDFFITLTTCSYEFDDARYVVVGKLVPLD